MYGTVARYRLKPGREADALALIDELAADLPHGYVAAYTYRLDAGGDEYITAAVWIDRETYVKNASYERQRRWYERVRELLVEEPTWHDGEVIHATTVRRGAR
jgi:hypothetical protein